MPVRFTKAITNQLWSALVNLNRRTGYLNPNLNPNLEKKLNPSPEKEAGIPFRKRKSDQLQILLSLIAIIYPILNTVSCNSSRIT